MSYTARIMNLKTDPKAALSFKLGHRNARHAAAEIAAEADARLEVAQRMAEALRVLVDRDLSYLGGHLWTGSAITRDQVLAARDALAEWEKQ